MLELPVNEQLIIAIYEQDIEKIKTLLLSPKIDLAFYYRPKSKNLDKALTPLQFAAGGGNTQIIELLLNKGADPLAKSELGRSALSIAAYYGHLDACKCLLPVSDVTSRDATQVEAYGNAERAIQNIKDADRQSRCQAVKDFLRIPTYREALRVDDLNLAKKMVDVEKVDLAEVFVGACCLGDTTIVSKMLRLNLVDINVYFKGKTGLHVACWYGKKDVVYELLSTLKLDINAPSTAEAEALIGYTCLHYVCLLNNNVAIENNEVVDRVDIADALINHGADLNLKNADGWAPIHKAITYNQIDLVKLFVMAGADLNVRVKIPDDIVKKHMPNLKGEHHQNLLSFSASKKEINHFLQEVLQNKISFEKGQYLGGAFRFNFKNPEVKTKPFRFDEFYEKNIFCGQVLKY